MGGVGSGGRGRGQGRKPLSDEDRARRGDAGRRGRVLSHPGASSQAPQVPSAPAAALPVLDEADCPNDLILPEERKVWLDLAPHAMQNGTLVAASSYAFVLLCKNVVRERVLSMSECGSADHRGIISKVEAALDAFDLRPKGKPMPAAEKPKEQKQAASYW